MAAAAGAEVQEPQLVQETHKLKHTKIVVWVEEAQQDLLVVSFTYGTVSFQGVLLHSSRKKWPYGLVTPNLTSYTSADKQTDDNSTSQQPAEADDDNNKLFAVSQRFSYLENNLNNYQQQQQQQQPKCTSLLPVASKVSNRRFDRNTRTMRLRPRQVLCSKCKSICNENSENVEESNASRRESEVGKSGTACQVFQRNSRKVETVAVPATTPNQAKVKNESSCDKIAVNCANNNNNNNTNTNLNNNNTNKKRVALETSNELTETKNKQAKVLTTSEVLSKQNHTMSKTTPFIKISFGPQGTIVKIPPRTRTYTASDTDAEGGTTPPQQQQVQIAVSPSHSSVAAKVAKKALKKAKKEARRKMNYPNSSPLAHLEIQKQRHRKHKFKHKRRHKDEQERRGGGGGGAENDGSEEMMIVNGETRENWDCNNIARVNEGIETNVSENGTQYNDVIKKECLKQKLSINLKRVNEQSYTKCSSSSSSQSSTSGNSSNSEDSNSSSTNKSNSEVEETVPEFPSNEMSEMRPLMMRIISHGVDKCTLEDGRNMSVGDVVWGKIHGFPWWPGKVLSITVSQRDNGMLINQQAHVAWFGSSTSSCMPCRHLVPFLQDFQSRYNKKKRGPYKEAIKQAIRAAQSVQSNGICDLSVQTAVI